jgi:hypothetical protein
MRLTNGILSAVIAGLIGVFSMTLASPAHAQRNGAVSCSSQDGRYNRCNVPWRDARMIRQDSRGDCIRDQSWGIDRRGLWVDRGCRAVFVEARGGDDRDYHDRDRGHRGDRGYSRDDSYGWSPGPGWDRAIQLECASRGEGYQMCRVDVGRRGHVRLVRQVSRGRCIEGRSWGWNRAGVWVNYGCRGQFVVDRRW